VDDHQPTYVGWDHPHDTPGDMKPHCFLNASAYTGKTTDVSMITQVGKWVSRRLTPDANVKLAQPITLEELKRAI